MTYPEIYNKLNYEIAIITFFKKDGTIRTMLGTRNLATISILYGYQGTVLGGHDNRCNIKNGNIAVYDMVIGDARSFSVDRLIDIQYCGVISTKEGYDKVYEEYRVYKEEYERSRPSMTITMEDVR